MEPALTPEEWELGAFRRKDETVVLHEKDGTAFNASCYLQGAEYSEHVMTISDSEWGPKAIPALMAVANATLPDGDPQKFTQKDVDDLKSMAVREMAVWAEPAICERIAAKIEVLLPPRAE